MKHIGKYQILGLLGIGGMGRVYKVRLPVAERVVALKLLAPREELVMLLSQDEVERRFLDEVRVLGALSDPHIAQVLDVDRDRHGRPFYCMDFCCLNLGLLIGEHYESETPTRVLPVEAAARYAAQTLAALERLHHHGVVHRDVKPFNLLVGPEDDIRLIDFGLSKLRGETRQHPGGLAIGTPFYTAPEQEADPEAVDGRADLYAIGVVLWRMLTGHVPAERMSERRAPSRLNPPLGEAWDEFLLRAAHPDPETRFPTAQAMTVALHDALDEWRGLANNCVLPPDPIYEGVSLPTAIPRKIRSRDARIDFELDALMRPAVYAPNHFEPRGETLFHPATGLTWQREGSHFAMPWTEAETYVAGLNTENFGGRVDWRLPTVTELTTILRPPTDADDPCVASEFALRQRQLWSSDAKAFTAAWFVDARLGFVAFADHDCPFFVRAVRGPA